MKNKLILALGIVILGSQPICLSAFAGATKTQVGQIQTSHKTPVAAGRTHSSSVHPLLRIIMDYFPPGSDRFSEPRSMNLSAHEIMLQLRCLQRSTSADLITSHEFSLSAHELVHGALIKAMMTLLDPDADESVKVKAARRLDRFERNYPGYIEGLVPNNGYLNPERYEISQIYRDLQYKLFPNSAL